MSTARLLTRAELEAATRDRIRAELARRQQRRVVNERSVARCEEQLSAFIREGAWGVLEPATTYLHNWHIDAKCEYLTAVTLGQITRLLINEPPRYMKSIVTSVAWPVWEWGPRRLPHLRYLFSSYSGELVTKHSTDRRTLIQSAWYQERWGGVFSLEEDNNRKTEFLNNKRGVMSTTSTGATATGKGGNRLVVDDPTSIEQSYSDVERASANRHFDQTLYTRLDNKQRDAIVIIMQRQHQQDLTGHVLARHLDEKEEQGWTVLRLEAEAEERRVISLPISKREITRERGDLLWAEREPVDVLAATKRRLGSYGYAGQYQQRPTPLEGGVIQKSWFRRFDLASQAPRTYHRVIVSADPKFKDYETASHVAVHTYGQVGADIYLLARTYAHLGLVGTCEAVLRHAGDAVRQGHAVSAVLVEDKANGPAVIESLRKKLPGLIAVEPDGSKEARALAASPIAEAGNIWIPFGPWGDEVIEALGFVPNGSNWDDVDAWSQAVRFLTRFAIIDADTPRTFGQLTANSGDGYLTGGPDG